MAIQGLGTKKRSKIMMESTIWQQINVIESPILELSYDAFLAICKSLMNCSFWNGFRFTRYLRTHCSSYLSFRLAGTALSKKDDSTQTRIISLHSAVDLGDPSGEGYFGSN